MLLVRTARWRVSWSKSFCPSWVRPRAPDSVAAFKAGVPLFTGDETAIHLDDAEHVQAIATRDKRYGFGSWTFGLGYRARVYRRNMLVGNALYEPFLNAEDGRIASIDGGSSIILPIRIKQPNV